MKHYAGLSASSVSYMRLGQLEGMELETLTTEQGMLQSIIGLAVFAGAAYIGGFMDES